MNKEKQSWKRETHLVFNDHYTLNTSS